jgi:hypothetical protein
VESNHSLTQTLNSGFRAGIFAYFLSTESVEIKDYVAYRMEKVCLWQIPMQPQQLDLFSWTLRIKIRMDLPCSAIPVDDIPVGVEEVLIVKIWSLDQNRFINGISDKLRIDR